MSTLRVLIGLLFVLNFHQADACTMVSTIFPAAPISCNGSCDGVLTLITSGGTAPYMVNNPVTGGTVTYMGTTTFTGICAGTYTFSITDAAGCNNVQVITVTEPTAVNITGTYTDPSSAGASDGSISATASGGTAPYAYSINGGPLQSSDNFTGLPAGTYNVCATDINGCSNCETFVLTAVVSCAMVSTVFVTSPITCFGDCNGVVTLASTMGTPPYITNNPFAGTGPVTYTSSTTFTGVCAGTYTFSITDAAGCNNVQVITVTEPTAVNLTGTYTDPSSAGASDGSISATASGGTAPYAYSLNGGPLQSSGNFTGLPAGTYNVCATDINGCSNCETFVLTAMSSCTMVSTVFMTSPITCFGDCSGVVTLASTMGTPPYITNNPFGGGGPVTYTSSTTFSGVCAGVYTFSITDAAGCNNVQVLTVTQPSEIILVTSPIPVSSGGTCDGSITPTASGGVAPYQYSIDGGTSWGPPPFTGLCQGVYTVCVQDAAGCITCETVDLSSPSGMKELNAAAFSIYPNPTAGRITIRSNGLSGQLVLTSVLGQPVSSMPFNRGAVDLDLDAMGLENGVYFLNCLQDNRVVQTSRIVLSR